MNENETNLPRCQGIRSDGQRCERVVGASQQFCYSHDASRREDRRASASKAAKSKLSSEIVAIREEIREIMNAVREKKLTRGDGAILLQGTGMLLKTVSEARKQSEYDEIRGEMAELRQLFEAQRGVYG